MMVNRSVGRAIPDDGNRFGKRFFKTVHHNNGTVAVAEAREYHYLDERVGENICTLTPVDIEEHIVTRNQ